MTSTELRRCAREHVKGIIEDDLKGRSENLKETWEQCENKADIEVVNDELRRIMLAIDCLKAK